MIDHGEFHLCRRLLVVFISCCLGIAHPFSISVRIRTVLHVVRVASVCHTMHLTTQSRELVNRGHAGTRSSTAGRYRYAKTLVFVRLGFRSLDPRREARVNKCFCCQTQAGRPTSASFSCSAPYHRLFFFRGACVLTFMRLHT